MFRSMMSYGLFPLWVACALAAEPGAVAVPPAAPASADQATPANRVQEIRNELAKPVSLDKGFPDNTTLREALEFLADHYKIQIFVNATHFQQEGNGGALEDMTVKLPKMRNVRLGTILRVLLAQLHASYLIRPDYLEIVPFEGAYPGAWKQRRDLAPTVEAEFSGRPLEEALRELAEKSGINIVLDGRAGGKAKTNITAALNNVPIDTAVLIVADMADMRSLAVDNVLYVTSKENAEHLQTWQEKQGEMAMGRPE